MYIVYAEDGYEPDIIIFDRVDNKRQANIAVNKARNLGYTFVWYEKEK